MDNTLASGQGAAIDLLNGKGTQAQDVERPNLVSQHFENKMAGKLPQTETKDSFSDKMAREGELFNGLMPRAMAEAIKYVEEKPGEVAKAAGEALLLGAALASAAKNPGTLGKRATPYLKGIVEWSPKVFGTAAAIDVTHRVGEPMYQTWTDKDSLPAMQNKLARNVGTGMVDYSVAMGTGLLGGVAGWKATPEWVNRKSDFRIVNTDKAPTKVENEAAFTTKKESTVKDDVVELYEKSFPLEERQPTDEVKELVAAGRILVHATRDAAGKLQSFSFSSVHDETAFKFINLDFIATNPSLQSKGIGSLHASRINEQIRAERPDHLGMTLEMEAVAEAGLPADVFAMRTKRAEYYDRQKAFDTGVEYKIFDFQDRSYRGPAEWRAWPWNPDKFDAKKAARLMITDEGGYGLPVRSREVKEFDAANNYHEPLYGPLKSGLTVAPTVPIANRMFSGEDKSITAPLAKSSMAPTKHFLIDERKNTKHIPMK